ncbi:hypothetical protein RFI_31108, partial [Reticulomyxa filosa]
MVEWTDDTNAKNRFIEEQLLPAVNDYEYFVSNVLPQCASKRPFDADEDGCRAPFYMTDVLRLLLFKAEQQSDVILQQVVSYTLRVILTMGLQWASSSSGSDRYFSVRDAKHSTTMSDFWSFEQHLAVYLQQRDVRMASGEGIICDQEFAIYSKGTGVLCTRPQGIPQNQFVVSFIGEVYPAWCWYEKSERIRWLEKSLHAEKQSDFFNITLERHCDDPEGYDVVFIDSSKKGNFASRISHSCQPNCVAVSMAVHGKYGIQVYSIRDIKCGEELSFDYNSVTEDEQEWKQAVCLCGMKSCRSYYLAYSGSDSYTDVLHKQHHVLHRTAALYRACCSNGDGSEFNDDNKQAQDLFVKYSLGNSVLRGVPVWMKLFSLHILQYIELEDKLLPLELIKLDLTNNYSLKDAEEEAFGVKRTRIQNLVLTLVGFLFFNKMKFFFRNGENARQIHIPPLQALEGESLVKKIWVESDGVISHLR